MFLNVVLLLLLSALVIIKIRASLFLLENIKLIKFSMKQKMNLNEISKLNIETIDIMKDVFIMAIGFYYGSTEYLVLLYIVIVLFIITFVYYIILNRYQKLIKNKG